MKKVTVLIIFFLIMNITYARNFGEGTFGSGTFGGWGEGGWGEGVWGGSEEKTNETDENDASPPIDEDVINTKPSDAEENDKKDNKKLIDNTTEPIPEKGPIYITIFNTINQTINNFTDITNNTFINKSINILIQYKFELTLVIGISLISFIFRNKIRIIFKWVIRKLKQ